MSTTTVSFSSTTRDAEIEALRRREAAAREAARRRIGIANEAIAALEARFQQAVAQLDAAARRLPDLRLAAPKLPGASASLSQDPSKLEAFAAQLGAEVDRFSRQLNAAIGEAERLLDRRIKKAAAWRCAADLEQHIDLLGQRCRDDAVRAGEDFNVGALPRKPGRDAELEQVEADVATLRRCRDDLEHRHAGLRARLAARETSAALAGGAVGTRSADDALSNHASELTKRSIAALRAHLEERLGASGLCLDELPTSLRARIEFALEEAHRHDSRPSITRWIAREKQQRDGVARALTLLGHPPVLINDDPRLADRWAALAMHLQRIAGGLEDLVPGVEREYEQLSADAQCLVNTAFTKADWLRALNTEGFEVFERTDGEGLVIVDIENPATWLEATPLEAEDGGFGATLELKTDAGVLAAEASVTDAICARLARVAASATPEIATQAEVIEHERRITRARRPKTFAERL